MSTASRGPATASPYPYAPPAGDPACDRADAERSIDALLAQRDLGKTICPSEAARDLGGYEAFRELMDLVRDAARAMVAPGELEVTQKGEVIDLDESKGPIRLRRPA